MSHRADQPGRRERVSEASTRGTVGSDRLLDERVDPGAREGQPHPLVLDGRHSDNRHVDACRDQGLDVRQDVQGSRHAVWVTTWIRHGNKVDAGELTKHPRVVTAHRTEADQSGAQRCHHAPAFASVLTA